jgi:adenine-specific DNA methylase
MTDQPRLIEYALPLKQASLDSVHEKKVRHGHISTLHIWSTRRPLAACRAEIIATLSRIRERREGDNGDRSPWWLHTRRLLNHHIQGQQSRS